MRRLLVLLSSLLLAPAALAQTSTADTQETLVVANRDIPAGRKLTQDDLKTRQVPKRVTTGSMTIVADGTLLLGTRVLEPIHEGEPILWTHLAHGFRSADVEPYCARIAAARKKPKAYPKRKAGEPVALIEVLVASKRLPPGTPVSSLNVLTAKMPSDFAGPLAVRPSELKAITGEVLLVGVEPGDNLRYSMLGGYASEPRCEWLREDVGNRFVTTPPPDAAKRKCGPNQRRIAGVPRGEEWATVEPGYAVACLSASGEAEGPYTGWDRLSGIVSVEGAFKAGKRHGKWTFRHSNGKKFWEREYREGVPVGTWAEYSRSGVVIGAREFKDGYREGRLLTAPVRGDYVKGMPTGTWRVSRPKGPPADVNMGDEVPPTYGAVGLYARSELPVGHVLAEGDFEERPIDELVAGIYFVEKDTLPNVLGHALTVNLPANAPLAWDDVEPIPFASLPPVPAAPEPPKK